MCVCVCVCVFGGGKIRRWDKSTVAMMMIRSANLHYTYPVLCSGSCAGCADCGCEVWTS